MASADRVSQPSKLEGVAGDWPSCAVQWHGNEFRQRSVPGIPEPECRGQHALTQTWQ
jgi:hypothetical protein